MRAFKIKICGITNPDDALSAAAAGADAIGLNFYEHSRRHILPEAALEVVTVCPPDLALVGVFVNNPVADIVDLAEHLQLAAIQLHGDEEPGVMKELGASGVIRAVRIGDRNAATVESIQREIDDWCEHGVSGILVDAAANKHFGGTGATFDWSILDLIHIPVTTILAGGLTADNVAAAITNVKPDAVDVASGVENSPGGKDVGLMNLFVQNANQAFAE